MLIIIVIAFLTLKLLEGNFKPRSVRCKRYTIPGRARVDPRKELEQCIRLERLEQREAERMEKKEREREQAEDDIYFYNEQLAIIRTMLTDAETRLTRAETELNEAVHINSVAPGAITQKEMSRRQRERDRAATKVITLQNKVHSLDIKRGKAYYKLDT